jgi:sugar phosphate isomerase/epimerase
MIASINRRTFVASAALALTAGDAFAQPVQTFKAGLVASAPRPAGVAAPALAPGAPRPVRTDQEQVDSFLAGMSDASRLGVRYVEKTNGPDPLLNIYKGRESAFKDELDKRNLKLAGLANNCHAARPELKQAMIEQNLRTARFIKAMGGTYIALVLDPTEGSDQSGDEAAFRKLDPKVIAANVDEMARTAYEETGITVGYHPEDGDSAAGLVDYLMQNTKHLMFFPDIGWMQMAGMDAVASCKKYYSRINGMHLRDFQPQPAGAPGRGIVPLGQGTIDLKALMTFLREQKFTGFVIGEGQSNQSNYDYMHGTLGLTF